MSIRMRYADSDSLEVYLGTISKSCEKAGLDAQKEGAKVVKKAVVKRLQAIRTTTDKTKHMADDVQISTRKDKFGDTVVKVQGGKATGTLWHIVNDGTIRSDATHFMDLALNEVEQELNQILDSKLGGALGD